jgi:hypothetical protein
MAVSHTCGKLFSAVPTLLLFSLGFVLGMTYNSRFPTFYSPSVAPSSPTPAPLPPGPKTLIHKSRVGTLPGVAQRHAQHDRRGAAVVGIHDAQGCLFIRSWRERQEDLPAAAAAVVAEVARGTRRAVLHLRAHRSFLHRLAAGGHRHRLLRPHDPKPSQVTSS